MLILEIILMGSFATLFMDLGANFLTKRKLIYAFIEPEAIGRWFLYIFKGKFKHQDIHNTSPLKNEKLWCLISHYLIGIMLAGAYLIVELKVPVIRDQEWIVLIYGIATIIFPWFWLLPSIGLGIMAAKSQKRAWIIRTNLVNHTLFGLGLFIWIIFFHRLFI